MKAMTAAQPDLFAPPARPLPPLPPPFDPARHPCAICGAAHAPFGRGWPLAPKFYCRQHFEAPMTISPATRNADDVID
jgi:hypothetical protein